MKLEKLTEYFVYLDRLRASGITNMFSSPSYMEKRFNLTREQAQEVVSKWMRVFEEDKSPLERAREVL